MSIADTRDNTTPNRRTVSLGDDLVGGPFTAVGQSEIGGRPCRDNVLWLSPGASSAAHCR
jgi:hypothetical protein